MRLILQMVNDEVALARVEAALQHMPREYREIVSALIDRIHGLQATIDGLKCECADLQIQIAELKDARNR